jgi:hypothetical protein
VAVKSHISDRQSIATWRKTAGFFVFGRYCPDDAAYRVEPRRFSCFHEKFYKSGGCAGLSLPAARFIMAAIPQTFCSPFSAALSFTSWSINIGTQPQ